MVSLQQTVCHSRNGVDEVLAIIEYKEKPSSTDRIDERFIQLLAAFFGHSQRRSDRLGHERRVSNRPKLDEPYASRKLALQLGGDMNCQARLADTAHTRDRDEPHRPDETTDLSQLRLSSNQAGHWARQVVRPLIRRLNTSKMAAAVDVLPGLADLPWSLGPLEPA